MPVAAHPLRGLTHLASVTNACQHYKYAQNNTNTQPRTEDPWEASLFYVPAAAYAYASNTGEPVPHLRRVMTYVAETHPWFNRSGGGDHVIWLPGA